MSLELTTKEVAEELDIPLGTLKGWLKKIPVPANVDSAGNRRFNEPEIDIIRRIRVLRLEDGRGMETIRRRLDLDHKDPTKTNPSCAQDEARTDPGHAQDEFKVEHREAPAIDASIIVDAVTAAIAQQTELAERYARAAHQIGSLESEVKMLRGQLEEAKQESALLKSLHSRPWWKFWG